VVSQNFGQGRLFNWFSHKFKLTTKLRMMRVAMPLKNLKRVHWQS